ncbi:MAG: hypothetical protein ACFCD0_12110 [Gemmataceae bacterium]
MILRLRYLVLALCFAYLTCPVTSPTPVVHAAEHEEGDKHSKGEDHGKGDDHGTHDESPLRWAADLTIWTLVVFLAMFFILQKYAWPVILGQLKQREEKIAEAMQRAETLQAEINQKQQEFQEGLAQKNKEVVQMMEEARRDAEALKAKMKADAETEIGAERERLRREIKTARDHILQEVINQAGDLATLISTKVIRNTLSHEDHQRLVEESLAELKQNQERSRDQMRQFAMEWANQGASQN